MHILSCLKTNYGSISPCGPCFIPLSVSPFLNTSQILAFSLKLYPVHEILTVSVSNLCFHGSAKFSLIYSVNFTSVRQDVLNPGYLGLIDPGTRGNMLSCYSNIWQAFIIDFFKGNEAAHTTATKVCKNPKRSGMRGEKDFKHSIKLAGCKE